ncbi:MAG: carbohydrate porin [Bacteroidota bacterium]|nr:carbohydrate porin [Bacteroidota bacterium]
MVLQDLRKKFIFFIPAFTIGSLAAQDSFKKEDRFNFHFQTTYVYQYKPSFHSAYEGNNSLAGKEEKQNSITATLYLGAKLWRGAELYINPEIAGGSGLSGALGMAGSSNGETFRVGNPSPTLYSARYFIKQAFGFANEKEWRDDEANQLAGYTAKKCLTLYFGKFSLGDLFDNNEYSNSPRTQFMNWALMNNGAWDYAANVRGYTYSFSTELRLNNLSYKLALAALPKEANGEKLNTRFKDSFALAINAEIDKAYLINGKKGNTRLVVYHNNTNMGNYKEAIKMPGIPDIIATRKKGRTKSGAGINFDQELTKTTGLFGRLGWNDGKNETWAFTEIDRTVSLGVSCKGNGWKREDDNMGGAIIVNGLSKDHRNYLAKGGSGFILGDGALNYSTEAIAELYYNLKPSTKIPMWFTGDYQFVLHPGYNKDRGPVNIFSIRVHTEF